MPERPQPTGSDLPAAMARLEALNRLSAGIAAAQDRDEIMRLVVEATARLLGAPYAVLWTVDAAQAYMAVAAEAVGKGLGPLPPQPPVPLSQSFATTVLREGRPVAVPDVRHHPCWTNQDWPGLAHLGAYVGVPLARDEVPVGVLAAMDRPGRTFTDDEAELLPFLATHAALAIEKAALLQAARRATEQAKALLEVGKLLGETVDLNIVFARITEKAMELLQASACYVGLLERDGAEASFRFPHTRGVPPAYGQTLRLGVGEGVTGKAFEQRRPVWTPDVLNDPGLHVSETVRQRMLENQIPRAVLAAPMTRGHAVIGILTVLHPTGTAYAPTDVEVLAALAGQAAIAIENARLFQQEHERRRQVEAVRAVTEEITRELDLAALLQLIAQRAAELSKTASSVIYVWDEEAQVLVPRAWHGFTDWIRDLRLRLGEGLAGAAAQRRERMQVSDYRTSPQAHPLVLKHTDMTAAVAEPLLHHDRLVGVIVITNQGSGRGFSEQDYTILSLFASQAAIAIHNARLYEDSQRRAREAAALAEVGRALSATLDMDRVFEVIVEEVRRLIGVPFAGIMTLDEERQELAYVTGVGMAWERLAAIRLKVGEGIAGRAVEEGQPVQSSRRREDPRFLFPRLAGAEGFRSAVCVPLFAAARPMGVLAVFRREDQEFSQTEVQLLTRFADQAALAIENARLYQRQRHAAAEAERQRAMAEALAAVGQAISASLDLDDVLALVAERAAGATGADAAAVLERNPATGHLRFRKAHGLAERDMDLYSLPDGMVIAGAAIASGQPAWTSDLPHDPRFRAPGHLLPLVGEEGIRGTISVPIRGSAEPFGVLSLYWRTPHAFEEGEIAFAVRIAEQAAIAIENARLYQEVAAHAETLEARVRERTAELEKANRAKTEFLTNMSHELRTPLNAIIGFSEMLHMQSFGPLNPKQQRYVTNIKSGGVHLLNLVNDVLDLARVEAGRLVLHRERVLLPPILTEVLDTVRPQAEKKELALACELAADLPALWADPVRLRQILVNLLSNAVKFTPSGGRVAVRAARRQAVDGTPRPRAEAVEIRVEDTGIGFTPDDLGRLFRKFEQLDGGLSKAHQGTGLGLALTRGLVELHGGTIAASSDGRGQGATFTVRLPVGTARERPEVLVVDDDPLVAEMLTSALRGWGWEAVGAASLAEARATLRRATPDLVIQDVGLEDGSGVEFAREVRRALAPGAAILMYTGLGAAEGEAALEAGADDYVVKPAPLEVIRRKAGKLLARAGWTAAALGEEPRGGNGSPAGAERPAAAPEIS